MGNLFQKLKELFSSHKMEIVLIGIENSGKTTLLNQLTQGEPKVTAPTIGLNIKQVKKGNINMKVWDIGGQVQYRCEWNRYTKEADAIIFMVDASNADCISISKKELHTLLEDKGLSKTPILVLGNKCDINPHLNEKEIMQGLNLDYINNNMWIVKMVSALKGDNIVSVVDWLISKSKNS